MQRIPNHSPFSEQVWRRLKLQFEPSSRLLSGSLHTVKPVAWRSGRKLVPEGNRSSRYSAAVVCPPWALCGHWLLFETTRRRELLIAEMANDQLSLIAAGVEQATGKRDQSLWAW